MDVEQELKVGQKMPDGTVYAGVSPDTGRAMYAAPKDTPLTHTFEEVAGFPAAFNKFNPYGHRDWRMPTKRELNVMFQNRAAIGGFDTTGSSQVSWYWTCSQVGESYAWAQRFSDGLQFVYHSDKIDSALRCVRG